MLFYASLIVYVSRLLSETKKQMELIDANEINMILCGTFD